MTHVQHRISMLLLAGALAVATIAAIPATAAIAADTPGTGTCTTTITGPLTGAFTFCNSSTVGGAISVATSTGFILIGDGGEGTCAGGHIDGAVTLNANSGG